MRGCLGLLHGVTRGLSDPRPTVSLPQPKEGARYPPGRDCHQSQGVGLVWGSGAACCASLPALVYSFSWEMGPQIA